MMPVVIEENNEDDVESVIKEANPTENQLNIQDIIKELEIDANSLVVEEAATETVLRKHDKAGRTGRNNKNIYIFGNKF